MNEKQEEGQRKKAIRLWLKGIRPTHILEIVLRGWAWWAKWKERYQQSGWKGLRSQSRQPQRSPQAYALPIRRLIVRVYHQVQKRRWGLRGLSAVRHQLRVSYRLRPAPSLSTLRRVLSEAEVFKGRHPSSRKVFYPQPRPTSTYTIQAMDWTERFLYGGEKVYAFHTIDLETRAVAQTIAPDKTTATVITHLKKVWKTRGIPQGLQMDNDTAFYGSRRVPRLVSHVVRLGLYLGIEPIFIPVGEAERNGDVEQLHGVWDKAVWQRIDFATVRAAQGFTPRFERWYMNEYEPPSLNGRTPQETERGRHRFRLTERLWQTIPAELPITAGRVHFIRRVSDSGTIEVLNEQWPISKRLAGQYVWAVLWTHRRLLEVFHRRSAESPLKRIKTFRYPLAEAVEPLRSEFKQRTYRRKSFAMS